jgi:hypothetical protein
MSDRRTTHLVPSVTAVLALLSALAAANTMTRLSVDTTWHPGNAASCASFNTTMPMSGDGRYIAFDSLASNLVLGDTNNSSDVFVQERATGKLVRVSVSSSGAEGNSWSVDPAISSTGRYVVFRSAASNLVANDTNGSEDIFLHDRDPDGNGVFDGGNGVTIRISVDSSGKQTTGICGAPTISSDGTKVVFVSSASTLVKGKGDTNGSPDAFLRNVAAGTTTRVSVDSRGKEANFGCVTATLSPNGSTVAFSSDSTNLVKGDTNAWRDVFVRDLAANNTVRVSVDSSGAEANGASNISPHCLSDNGNVVAFWSYATNLVANDTNGVGDVFVRDQIAGTTVRASVAWNGAQGDDESTGATIDAMGDRVAFSSLSSNLGFGTDPTRDWDVYARFLPTAETWHISRSPTSGVWANDSSSGATISPDGYLVQFGSNASDLVNVDFEENGHIRDVFVRDIIYTSTTYVSALPPGGEGNGYSVATSISANGRYVTFRSVATNLVPFDNNGHQDVFVADRTTGAIVRVSVSSTGAEGDGDSDGGSLSSDGRFVAFASYATNLITPATTSEQVFLRDRDPDGNGIFDESNATTTLMSTVYRTPGNGPSDQPRISEDANWIAFRSYASDLVAFDTNMSSDIFVKQLFGGIGGAVTVVSVSSTGVFGDDDAFNPAISADGSVIAFESFANNLVSNDTEGNDQFVHNRVSGITNWVDPVEHGYPYEAGWLSADGTKLVFASKWTTIVTPDDNGTAEDVFLVDFVNGTTTRVDVSTAGVQANGPSATPAISRDGRYVAFTSFAYNLVAGANGDNVYLRDLLLGETTLVSVNLSGDGNNGESILPLVADQGDFVVFTSGSSDLVFDDLNNTADVFLYDR